MAAVFIKNKVVRKLMILLFVIIVISTIIIYRKMRDYKERIEAFEFDENGDKILTKEWMTNSKRSIGKAKIEKLNSYKNQESFINSIEKMPEQKKSEIRSQNFLKVFHLDLKGAPPKMNYLLNILPIIRKAGANGILIEYEDMFPFTGRLKNISAKNSYALREVQNLVQLAETLKMEVIPLVQTFGHLEFVLKLEEFRHLRELDSFPQELCPSKRESMYLIKEIIKQVMNVHKNSKYIHIGCDEVYHIAACPVCSKTHPRTIFVKHVMKIGNHVRNAYPGITPLIWDDMLRYWPSFQFEKTDLGSIVEPVVWVYITDINQLVPPYAWQSYQKTFPALWSASAFKGAFGETEIMPNISRHFENNYSWIRLMKNAENGIGLTPDLFKGIFLTGWSRYDHFAVLCELLPVGIPSLMLNLILLDSHFSDRKQKDFKGKEIPIADISVIRKWFEILQCPSDFPLVNVNAFNDVLFQSRLGSCSFPGNNLFASMTEYHHLKSRLNFLRGEIDKYGWLSEYNVKNNYTSPWRVLNFSPREGFGGEYLRQDILAFKSFLSAIMTQYYDNYTIAEWMEQKISPLENEITKIRSNFEGLIKRKNWQRRPLGYRGNDKT